MLAPNRTWFWQKILGVLHMSKEDPSKELSVNAEKMPGATKVVLEIAQPNRYFES